MKRWCSWLIVSVLLLRAVPIQAQSVLAARLGTFSCGLKAGINASNFIMPNLAGAESRMDLGGMFGGYARTECTEHFAEQEEVLVYYLTSNFDGNMGSGHYRYWGVQFPFYGMWQWKTKKGGRLYIGGGPYAEYGLSARYRTGGLEFDLYQDDGNHQQGTMTKLTIGAASLFGYELSCGLQLNASYKIGMTHAQDAAQNSFTLYPYSISLGLGYRFM